MRNPENTTPESTTVEVRFKLDSAVVAYFKSEASKLGIPYRTLICLALKRISTDGGEFKIYLT